MAFGGELRRAHLAALAIQAKGVVETEPMERIAIIGDLGSLTNEVKDACKGVGIRVITFDMPPPLGSIIQVQETMPVLQERRELSARTKRRLEAKASKKKAKVRGRS